MCNYSKLKLKVELREQIHRETDYKCFISVRIPGEEKRKLSIILLCDFNEQIVSVLYSCKNPVQTQTCS